MVRFYKITITNEGLRGYDFWGVYHTINWKGIIKVTPVKILGLKYIKINNEDSSRPLWIPLFLNDMDGFIKEVKGRLEADNPLQLYLQTEKNA